MLSIKCSVSATRTEAAVSRILFSLSSSMPRFAILAHDHPFPHWDFLLEDSECCRTWRLLSEPRPSGTVEAERIADHRLHYLDYEGPVSGDRGTVARFDAGTFEWVSDGLADVEIKLSGDCIAGRCRIQQISDEWRVHFEGSVPSR